jgi:hypothetical protein
MDTIPIAIHHYNSPDAGLRIYTSTMPVVLGDVPCVAIMLESVDVCDSCWFSWHPRVNCYCSIIPNKCTVK